MHPDTLQNSDYLDILFEGRNKKYGGYELRRNYPRRVKRSLGVLAGICLAVAAYGMANNNPVVPPASTRPVVMISEIITPPPPIDPTLPKPLPPPAAPAPPANTIRFTPPVIDKDNNVQETERPPEAEALKDALAGPKTEVGDAGALTAPVMAKPGGTGTGVVETGTAKKSEPFIYVEEMPEFNGNVNQYLASNIVYPLSAREAEGRVVIKFVISEEGSVTEAVVEKGVNGALDAEALRVVRSMPKWKPGRQNGKAVKVYFRVPVKFTLE